MFSTFRSAALAVAAIGCCTGAIAGMVELNFNDIDASAGPASVGAQYQSVGFTFSQGYGWSFANMDPFAKGDPAPSNDRGKGTFIVNRGRGGDAGEILISLREDLFGKGVFFKSISFYGYSLGDSSTDPLSVTGYKKGGSTGSNRELSNAAGNSAWGTSPAEQRQDFGVDEEIFELRLSAGTAAFGIDDLVINYYGTIDGGSTGNVPEPGSYALVGLALLAAGAATRRRT